MTFFSSAHLGLTSKIKFRQSDGQIHVEWDREDPELISIGFNDLTPDDWGQIIQKLEEEGVLEDLLD